ncbi:type I polyketide synthase, partial [Nonomuraea sp. NPDC048826]|uniref:type I polyketide synthase n=1 Tax=Nonomuraea sp. NPDC048826 TaxID=3364347 RepID=UPI003712C1ED
LLERQSDAQANNHPILAIIRGTAINQDGASNGLTAPNGPSQERVIRRALAVAGLSAGDVDAVEAHGTGTRLGDPIEAQALLATYGQEHEGDRPLWLGSLKSNLGHTQAAAGVGGVIKMVLAMRHGLLPKTLHVDEPTPHVDWSAGQVKLLTEPVEWRAGDRPRRAGVSSFGISGTNAHVILEEAPGITESAEPSPVSGPMPGMPPVIWPISGKTPAALRAQAARLRRYLDTLDEHALPAAGRALATTRAALEHRAVILADDHAQTATALDALSTSSTGSTGNAVQDAVREGKLAFLFTGQGAQRPGMGRDLYQAFPAFADAFDEALAHLPGDLRAIMWGDDAELLNQTEHTQPALFAFEIALYRLLRSWGLRPDYLAGHSIGEIAAAHAAGILTLPDAAALITTRARLMAQLPPGGAMIAVHATETEVTPLLTDTVAIAAINGPTSLVISGEHDATHQLAARLSRPSRALTVSHAFHSPLIDPVLEELGAFAATLTHHRPHTPLVSTLHPDADPADPGHWVRHARSAVRFHDALTHLAAHTTATCLELGPDAHLAAIAGHTGHTVIPLTRREQPEPATVLTGVAHAYTRGVRLDWDRFYGTISGPPVDLPTYPFQHTRHWLDKATADLTSAGLEGSDHPLVGAIVETADDGRLLLTSKLSSHSQSWLADHAIGDTTLVPAAVFLELALHAAERTGSDQVEQLILDEPLALPASGSVHVQISVQERDEAGRCAFAVHARQADGDSWTRHAGGTLVRTGRTAQPMTGQWPPAGAEEISLDGFYERLADLGYRYGPLFRGLRAAWRRGDALLAEVSLSEGLDGRGFGMHPALLDSALHAFLLDAEHIRLPFALSQVSVHAAGLSAGRVVVEPVGDDEFRLTVTDATGSPVLSIGSIALRELPAERLGIRTEHLYQVEWRPTPVPATETVERWVLLGDRGAWPTDDVVDTVADLAALEHEVAAGRPAPDHVVAVLTPGSDLVDVPGHAHRRTADALALLQRFLAHDLPAATRLVVITHGAVATDPTDLAGSALWGLIRSAQTEHPGRFALIDVDQHPASQQVLQAAVLTRWPQAAIRAGGLLVPRLTRSTPAGTSPPDFDHRTVLITGGTGALGSLVARHLAGRFPASHLLLISRQGPDAPGADALHQQLTAAGPRVTITACDTADPDALADLVAGVPGSHPLTAVIHTAGVLHDATLTALTPQQLADTLRPKIDAAWQLHQSTRHLPLTAFVLFSSIAGLIGTPGQANYAAANAFLDALAHHRHAQGLPATSLAWGPWDHTGMAATLTSTHTNRWQRTGLHPLPPDTALHLLDTALAHPQPLLAPVHLNHKLLRQQATAPAILTGNVPSSTDNAAGPGSLVRQLADAGPAQRLDITLDLVRRTTATVLGHTDAQQINPHTAFRELGFDSLAAVELRNQLATTTG